MWTIKGAFTFTNHTNHRVDETSAWGSTSAWVRYGYDPKASLAGLGLTREYTSIRSALQLFHGFPVRIYFIFYNP